MAKKSSVRRYLPLVMLVVGSLLAGGALWLALHARQSSGVPAGMVPGSLAGISRSLQTGGDAALDEIKQMHLGDFSMEEASVASYGDDNVTLWVASAGSNDAATTLIQQMTTAITAGGSPFTADGVYIFSGREVYGLSGMDQLHFYFQSGQLVVWISADRAVAETALIDAMAYYP